MSKHFYKRCYTIVCMCQVGNRLLTLTLFISRKLAAISTIGDSRVTMRLLHTDRIRSLVRRVFAGLLLILRGMGLRGCPHPGDQHGGVTELWGRIGTALLGQLIKDARAAGYPAISLSVDVRNPRTSYTASWALVVWSKAITRKRCACAYSDKPLGGCRATR